MDENSAPSALPGHLLAALDEWLVWALPAPEPDDRWALTDLPPDLEEDWRRARGEFLWLTAIVILLLIMPLLLDGRFPV